MVMSEENEAIVRALLKVGPCSHGPLTKELGTKPKIVKMNELIDAGLITGELREGRNSGPRQYEVTKKAIGLLEASELPFGIAAHRAALPTARWVPPKMYTPRAGADASTRIPSLGCFAK